MNQHKIQLEGQTLTVVPAGDVVATAVKDLKDQLKPMLSSEVQEVVIDLANAKIVDSMGIGFFVAVHNSVTKAGTKVSLVHVSKDLLELFHSLRIDRHIAVSGLS